MKLKNKEGDVLSMLLGTLGAKNLSGKGVIRAGEGAIRVGCGSEWSSLRKFDSYATSFNEL